VSSLSLRLCLGALGQHREKNNSGAPGGGFRVGRRRTYEGIDLDRLEGRFFGKVRHVVGFAWETVTWEWAGLRRWAVLTVRENCESPDLPRVQTVRRFGASDLPINSTYIGIVFKTRLFIFVLANMHRHKSDFYYADNR
jgi:hypothetical protein